MTEVVTEPQEANPALGTEVDKVWVEIDYAILQHFSKHLYTSPNKAVEELVTNGYDALATEVDVYLPGEHGGDHLLVWDNGDSMDVAGLKQLWWIARSPKIDAGPDRVAVSADGTRSRRMVGKFGIGKLASYSVGDQVSHLCRRGDEFLLVSVDYNQAPRLELDDQERAFSTPVLRLTVEEATTYARDLFNAAPKEFDALFGREHWTLAIVGELREGVSLKKDRLRWVLGNGMPLRPDFQVRVNSEAVTPSQLSDELVAWDIGAEELTESLASSWKGARDKVLVEGDPSSGCDIEGDHAKKVWCDLPGLGKCYVEVRLFASSLKIGRAGEHGRSEGFFVYVRDRLLNPDDAKLLLPDPSFGTFNRMQAIIHADGLDAELLADRERLQGDASATEALRVLQSAIYRASRRYLEDYDESESEKTSLTNLLPAESREYFRQPLVALTQHEAEKGAKPFNVAKASVTTALGSESEPLMSLRPADNQLVLNESHPLFTAARARLGSGQVAKEALRLVELLAISDTLLAGYLLDKGISDNDVADIRRWRDGQIRALAIRFERTPEEVIGELKDASYVGGARFEKAIAAMFRMMGFVAERDGLPGKKDVLVVAPIGRQEQKFTAEGKGKKDAPGAKGKVANDESEISGAAAHAKAADASFAVVVARDFKGFVIENAEGDEAAVLQESRCQKPVVSIVTVDALIAMYEAVKANQYPLTVMMPALAEIESPEDKLKRIASMEKPLQSFDTRGLLEKAWELQQGEASGMPVSVLQIKSSRAEWKTMPEDAFERVIFGLETMTGGLVTFDSQKYAVELLQSPDNVMQALQTPPSAPVVDGDGAGT